MKRVVVVALLSALVVTACTSARSSRAPGSMALFNGRDLTGWVVMHGGEWTVEDGALVGRNGRDWSTNPAVSGSWLRTEREYENFILDFEYAVEGNSGVFVRSALEKNPAFTGYELQLVPDAGRPPTKGSAGALYDVIAASKNMSRPAGAWNQVRILAEGDRIQIVWNGEMVLDFDAATRADRGYLGLQTHDENTVARFRNLRLTELPSGTSR
jgi:hypothetical protein